MLPKTSAYVKSYGQTKWMYCLIEDNDFLEKCITIWKNVSADITKNLIASLPNIFLQTKIKSPGNEVTDFYCKKLCKVDSNHTCLVVITLDSALTKNENYYSEVFLKECKYIEKK